MKVSKMPQRFIVSSLTAAVMSALFLSQPSLAAEGYWRSSAGEVITSGFKECVQTGFWPGAEPTVGCDAVAAVAEEPAPAPAPVVEAAPVPVLITLNSSGTALFDFDSANLTSAAKSELDKLAEEIKGYEKLDSVAITGHTDSSGSDQYNQGLSERRAASVKDYLVSDGLPADKITTSGKGESEPVESNATKEGRAKNRRVEIEITGEKAK